MKRLIAHILTSIIAFVIICVQLSRSMSVAMLLWCVPNVLTICLVVSLLLLNLKNKPVQIEDAPIVFYIAMISTNFCVVVSLFGNMLPIYQSDPLASLQTVGSYLNVLSMPFYACAILSLGRGFTILPEAHTLSARGIYKISRHPIYLTYIYWCITQNMIYQTWSVLAFSIAQIAMYCFRAKYEEKVLSDTFSEYEDYQKRVMWIGIRKSLKS